MDSAQYFPAMLQAIEGARHSLLLEFYLVESGTVMDRFCQALTAACRRGVRVCLLVDGFGAQALSQHDRRRLERAGVELRVFNPLGLGKGLANFSRDHRKLLVADGRIAFTGGTGLCDQFLSAPDGTPGWHELMLRVEGPVVNDWQRLFARLWNESGGAPLALNEEAVAVGDMQMKIATTRGLRSQEIKVNFRRHINGAEHRIWLATAYFLPSWSIRRALRNAALRGVDVRLLVPGPKTDHPGLYYAARRYYRPLLAAGARIYEYQPRFIHAKVGVCDHWLSLGSCNLDHWNLRWNLEANQEVQDARLAEDVYATFRADFAQSEEVTYQYWMARPWYQRVWGFCRGLAHGLVLRLF
ncbi:phosphatidylserine/phosphatidylglycerophosphate/cardiolipin synthase family protein [Motiliproteus sp. SC1-56]|uniref:phospholipase D-like domain-containing protein n=1 Tax=Motiliproteus sp. SC1-56 TaxID=2799565 RepID=UPI00351C1E8A